MHDGEGGLVANANISAASDHESLGKVSNNEGRADLTLTEHQGYVEDL